VDEHVLVHMTDYNQVYTYKQSSMCRPVTHTYKKCRVLEICPVIWDTNFFNRMKKGRDSRWSYSRHAGFSWSWI